MKILSFGCAGFIGSHLTKRLLSEGHRVVGLDIYKDKIEEMLDRQNLDFIQQDIRKLNLDIDELAADADIVIDLIAYANPGLYVKIPLEVFRLNFNENLKIVEACVRQKKRLIQFSSCEVYGKTVASLLRGNLIQPDDSQYAVFSEDQTNFVLGPVTKQRWIYACAKQLLERVIHAYGLESGLDYTIIRPFNFIGPKIDYLLDETEGIPRVFSFFMEALISGKPMQLVDGGHHRRCYTYIDDAIECIYRIVQNPSGICSRKIFNIGTPENEVTIRQLAEMMREIYTQNYSNKMAPVSEMIEVPSAVFYGEGYEDSDRRIPDITKARKLLGWEPKWKMRELIEATMDYYVHDYITQYRKQKNDTYFHDIIQKALKIH